MKLRYLFEDKISFGNYKTWSDPPVAFKDSDLNITDKAQNFALLMDKVAELLGLPEPIVTSGLRPPDRQVKAMFNIWKNNGSAYLIDLYAAKCKSCSSGAGDVAKQLAALWDKNKDASNSVPKEIFQQSIDLVAATPMSAHQSGDALDYGLLTNPGGNIVKMVDYIKQKAFANIELIDERKTGADGELGTGAGSHWHISVYGITPAGETFLNTNNESLKKEGKNNLSRLLKSLFS
jgi:hypothetical protein